MIYGNLSEVRKKLDLLTLRIINRLAYRTTFPLNLKVYEKPENGKSMLEIAIERKERYFAELGRWKFPDQRPLSKQKLPKPVIPRSIPQERPNVEIDVVEEVKGFFIELIKDLCKESDDPNSYGETVDCDADILELLFERIMLGLYVANSKANSDPKIKDIIGSPKLLEEKLRNMPREEEVVEEARKCAEQNNLNPAVIERCFRWIINETTKVEIEYLQKAFS